MFQSANHAAQEMRKSSGFPPRASLRRARPGIFATRFQAGPPLKFGPIATPSISFRLSGVDLEQNGRFHCSNYPLASGSFVARQQLAAEGFDLPLDLCPWAEIPGHPAIRTIRGLTFSTIASISRRTSSTVPT